MVFCPSDLFLPFRLHLSHVAIQRTTGKTKAFSTSGFTKMPESQGLWKNCQDCSTVPPETGQSCMQQSPCFKQPCNFLFLSLAFPHYHTHLAPRGMITHESQMELPTSTAQLPSLSSQLPAQSVRCEPSRERDGSGELSDDISMRKAEKNELRIHLGYTLESSIYLKVQHLCYCNLFRDYCSQLPNHMLESTALRFT